MSTKRPRSKENTSLKSTPWKINGWNRIMEVWFRSFFLSKWVICRFYVNLPGCKHKLDKTPLYTNPNSKNHGHCQLCVSDRRRSRRCFLFSGASPNHSPKFHQLSDLPSLMSNRPEFDQPKQKQMRKKTTKIKGGKQQG